MFENVIVGVDAAQGGRDAIALAGRLCAKGGELTLAHVYYNDPEVWRGSSPAYDAAETERADGLLENARREAGVEAQLRSKGSPSVGRGLHELAEAIGADLLIVGSSGRGLAHRVLIGDDTRAALNGARCAVAIAPTGYSQDPVAMREIGVGYDGSPESEHALRVARQLAAEHQTKVSVFEVVSLPTRAYMPSARPVDELVEEMVSDAQIRVAALEGVEPHAVYGDVAEELTLYSAWLDLLLIGSRSYGPIGRLVHGSTAQRLARTARCPLLVLTRGARRAEASVMSHVSSEAAEAEAAL